jgi:hypothetical protein
VLIAQVAVNIVNQIRILLLVITKLCHKFVSDLRQVAGFSAVTPVFSTNKTDRHDITETLLKVALNTIKQIGFFTCFIQRKSVVFSVTRSTPFPTFQDFLHSSSYQKPLCHVVVILGVESERREECCF